LYSRRCRPYGGAGTQAFPVQPSTDVASCASTLPVWGVPSAVTVRQKTSPEPLFVLKTTPSGPAWFRLITPTRAGASPMTFVVGSNARTVAGVTSLKSPPMDVAVTASHAPNSKACAAPLEPLAGGMDEKELDAPPPPKGAPIGPHAAIMDNATIPIARRICAGW